MLIQTNITFNQFCDTFRAMGRNEQYTYEGKKALYDYLDDQSEQIELDVIAFCCKFCEFSDIAEYNEQHGTEFESCDEIDAIVIKVNSDSFICSQ